MNQQSPIYYLGPQHSFHHLLALQLFGDSAALTAVDDTATLGKLLAENVHATGLLAIHNTVAGYLNQHYSIILDNGLFINQQATLDIHMHLCGLAGSDVSSIKTIGSHPVALKQCGNFLQTLQVRQVEYSSTSEAMHQVRLKGDPEFAAIGNQIAAGEFGLIVMASNIQDRKDNATRFAVLSKEKSHTTKTPLFASIILPNSAIPIANLLMNENHMQVLGSLTLPQHNAVIQEVALNSKVWIKELEEKLERIGASIIGLYGESIIYNNF